MAKRCSHSCKKCCVKSSRKRSRGRGRSRRGRGRTQRHRGGSMYALTPSSV